LQRYHESLLLYFLLRHREKPGTNASHGLKPMAIKQVDYLFVSLHEFDVKNFKYSNNLL